MNNEIVLFTDKKLELEVNFSPEQETVWLTANQMALLFERDEKTVRKHSNKIFKDGEIDQENNTQKMRVVGVKQPVAYYNLDVILSVGYRVNSQRGIASRRWANNVLKDYIIKGCAVNNSRLKQLGEVIRLIKRTEDSLRKRSDDQNHYALHWVEKAQTRALAYNQLRELSATGAASLM